MTEHDLYRSLKSDAIGLTNFRIKKLAGSITQTGLPDFIAVTLYGNFLIELKHINNDYFPNAGILPAKLFTPLQMANLTDGWVINRAWLGAVGWRDEAQTTYLRFVTPEQFGIPFSFVDYHFKRPRGLKWDFVALSLKLKYIRDGK